MRRIQKFLMLISVVGYAFCNCFACLQSCCCNCMSSVRENQQLRHALEQERGDRRILEEQLQRRSEELRVVQGRLQEARGRPEAAEMYIQRQPGLVARAAEQSEAMVVSAFSSSSESKISQGQREASESVFYTASSVKQPVLSGASRGGSYREEDQIPKQQRCMLQAVRQSGETFSHLSVPERKEPLKELLEENAGASSGVDKLSQAQGQIIRCRKGSVYISGVIVLIVSSFFVVDKDKGPGYLPERLDMSPECLLFLTSLAQMISDGVGLRSHVGKTIIRDLLQISGSVLREIDDFIIHNEGISSQLDIQWWNDVVMEIPELSL